MKKCLLALAAIFAFVFLAACANNSDDTALIMQIVAVKKRSALPLNVGTNELAGKTFKYTDSLGDQTFNYIYRFENSTYTYTIQIVKEERAGSYSAHTEESSATYNYSYNSETKSLYSEPVNSQTTIIRGGSRIFVNEFPTFSTDAEFIEAEKNVLKVTYDLASDETLASMAKERRAYFKEFGYPDQTCKKEVSDEIIASYNIAVERKKSLKLISIDTYSLSGSDFRIASDSRFPKGKGLNDLYGVYATDFEITDDLGIVSMRLEFSSQYVNPDFNLALMNLSRKNGYKVSFIDSAAINVTSYGRRSNMISPFDLIPQEAAFSYATNRTDEGAVFDINPFGKITIAYATKNNIPDISKAQAYTRQ